MSPSNKTKRDFSDIEGLMIAPRDPDIPREVLHCTPAIVFRELDHEKYSVNGLYYDGDRKGFVVTVTSAEGPIQLEPGQYRTHALFIFDHENCELNIVILD